MGDRPGLEPERPIKTHLPLDVHIHRNGADGTITYLGGGNDCGGPAGGGGGGADEH